MLRRSYLLGALSVAVGALAVIATWALTSPPTLEVDYAGCYRVRRGPICELSVNREIRFWARTDSGAVDISVSKGPRVDRTREVDGGSTFHVTQLAGSGSIVVVARRGLRSSRFRLEFSESLGPAWLDDAIKASTAGKPTPEARDRARRELETGPREERGLLLSFLARQAFLHGQDDKALELFAQALPEHRSWDRSFSFADDLQVASYVAIFKERRLDLARSLLEGVELEKEAPVEAFFALAYARGLFYQQVGDFRRAITVFEAIIARLNRLNAENQRRTLEEQMALALLALGRLTEARAILERLIAEIPADAPCFDQPRLRSNLAWVQLIASGQALEKPQATTFELLEGSRSGFTTCGRPDQRANVELSLASAWLQSARPADARTAIGRARDQVPTPSRAQSLWFLELEARLAAEEGRFGEARQLYGGLSTHAAELALPLLAWRGLVGQAEVERASGRADRALELLAQSEALIEENSLAIPLDAGRETYLASHQRAASLQIEILIDLGKQRLALEAARRSRSRLLRLMFQGHRLSRLSPSENEDWVGAIADYRRAKAALDAEMGEDWQKSGDEARESISRRHELRRQLRDSLDRAFVVLGQGHGELPSARAGELVLTWVRLARGWLAFAALDGEVEVHAFSWPLDANSFLLANDLVEPFAVLIDKARTIRVLPADGTNGLDFHLLPWRGKKLEETLPVVYGLDLPIPSARGLGEVRSALVVGDPDFDLPGARREAEAVVVALRRSPGLVVTRAPTLGVVQLLSEIEKVDLFHFSGHAAVAGRLGWESALQLKGGNRLELSDLLTLHQAPRVVVLSGCETGRLDSAAMTSMSLAHAFLIAGADVVVASSQPIDDLSSSRFFSDFYNKWSPGSGSDGFISALRLSRLEEESRDIDVFRVFVP